MSNSIPVVFATLLASVHLVTAGNLPFRFGNETGDVFTQLNDEGSSPLVSLPKPMTYKGKSVVSMKQYVNGYVNFLTEFDNSVFYGSGGSVDVYDSDIDTRNGGEGQNEVWLRAGTNASDLTVARDIIAGAGKSFSPEAVIVATWNKVEAYNRIVGPQNTFQLIMAYDESGTTWAIFAYAQLEYFASGNKNQAFVRLITTSFGAFTEELFSVSSSATMNELLTGTNCGNPGIYVFKVREPCGLLGLSFFCPFTFCGIFGRALGFCSA